MAQAIMKKMGYNTQNPIDLGGSRGIRMPLEPTLTKSQLEDWKLHRHIDKSSHALGYDPDTPPETVDTKAAKSFCRPSLNISYL